MRVKNLSIAATAVIASMAFCSTALAEQYYAGLTGGMNMTSSTKFHAGSNNTGSLKFKNGFNGGVILGVGTEDNIRYEVELDHMRASIKSASDANGATIDASGKVKNNVALFNVAYDFNSLGTVIPYAKVGAGYTRIKLSDSVNAGTATGNAFAYRGTLGMAYQLDSNVTTNLDYTYFGTTKAKFKYAGGDTKARLNRHNVNVSLIYTFA